MHTVTRSGHPLLAALALFTLLAGDFWRNLIGWGGYLTLALALTATLAVLVTRSSGWKRLSARRLPKSGVAFLALAVLSVAWSFYPGATVLGILAQAGATIAAVFLATALSWADILTALGRATRWILGLSLLFEFVVAVFVRQPIIPLWVDYGDGKLPDAFFWSLGSLFTGGPIQGIVGNRNLLAFVAVIALVALALEFAERRLSRARAIGWLIVAAGTLALTRSTTAMAVLVVVALAFGILVLARRVGTTAGRWLLVSIAAGTIVWSFSGQLLSLFGKSSDLTGRVDIWNAVSGLAAQRPVLGWGWVSYWVPWVEPFAHLAERKGVLYLQAHNAWLDVWFQLGVVGLIVFLAFVVAACWRSWWFAVDPQRDARGGRLPFRPVSLLPALVLAILVAQSFVESRMLLEGGWTLLVLMALKTKMDAGAIALDLGGTRTAARDAGAARAPAPAPRTGTAR